MEFIRTTPLISQFIRKQFKLPTRFSHYKQYTKLTGHNKRSVQSSILFLVPSNFISNIDITKTRNGLTIFLGKNDLVENNANRLNVNEPNCDWGKIKYYGQFILITFRLHGHIFAVGWCSFDLLTFIPKPNISYFHHMEMHTHTHLLQLVMRFFMSDCMFIRHFLRRREIQFHFSGNSRSNQFRL